MTISLGNLPVPITSTCRAVLWNPELRLGTSTKVPYQVRHPRRMASVDDPATWASFSDAFTAYSNNQAFGIGIVLDGSDRLVGVDLDKCRHPGTGAIAPWAQAIVDQLNTYTEASPSGSGLRMFVYASLPPGRRRKGQIEVYERGRYLTVTGDWIEGTPRTIEDRTAELVRFHASVFGAEPVRRGVDDDTQRRRSTRGRHAGTQR